jgi:hypothetical protein
MTIPCVNVTLVGYFNHHHLFMYKLKKKIKP